MKPIKKGATSIAIIMLVLFSNINIWAFDCMSINNNPKKINYSISLLYLSTKQVDYFESRSYNTFLQFY